MSERTKVVATWQSVADLLRALLKHIESFREAARSAKRRQELRESGDVWSSVDDMRAAALRAHIATLNLGFLLPENATRAVLEAMGIHLLGWNLCLTEMGNPKSPLRGGEEKAVVRQALAESAVWLFTVRHVLNAAEVRVRALEVGP